VTFPQANQRIASMLIQSDIVLPRQAVDNQETDIMPSAVVLASWIA
jgi:hypothetical protein